MDQTRKNTLKIVFGQGDKVPMYMDVLRFAGRKLELAQTDVHSIYKDEMQHQFFIKFMDEYSFIEFARSMEEHYLFEYGDCSSTYVRLEVASSLFRYVRIFNLPPEIDDKEIAMALEKFGVIRQHVREKYPADCGFVVFSGVRGVHMEISKELPANLFIGHCKARLYYEGLRNKCFYCKSEGHLKAECPKLAKLKASQNDDESTQTGSYSQVLANAVIGASASPVLGSLNMTSFPIIGTPNRSTEPGAAKEKPASKYIIPKQPEQPSTSGEKRTPTDKAENQADAETGNTKGDLSKRPKDSSSDDGSGADDKPPKKQQLVQPKADDKPPKKQHPKAEESLIDALGRRSRTMERDGSGPRSTSASRSRSRNTK